jgi:hypothetical protein
MPLARLDRTRRAYFGDAPEVDPLIVERQIIAEAVLTCPCGLHACSTCTALALLLADELEQES